MSTHIPGFLQGVNNWRLIYISFHLFHNLKRIFLDHFKINSLLLLAWFVHLFSVKTFNNTFVFPI